MKGLDLESMRAIFSDKRTHLAVAIVEQVEILDDLSGCRVQLKTMPEELEMVATMTWAYCSQGGGVFAPVTPKDLVLCAFLGPDEVLVISRISSLEDKVPVELKDGTTVIASLPGKKLLLKSDTEAKVISDKNVIIGGKEKVYVGKGGETLPTEPMVLGTQALAYLTIIATAIESLLDKLATGPLVLCGAPGTPGVTDVALKAALEGIKTQFGTDKEKYLTTADTNIISKTAFTER